MRVYVAGKFEESAAICAVYDKLRRAGHEITFPWAEMTETPDKFAKIAQDEIDGVLSADFFVLYPHDRGCGQFIELGIFIGTNGHDNKVIVVCPSGYPMEHWKKKTFFLHIPGLARMVKNTGEMLAILKEAA